MPIELRFKDSTCENYATVNVCEDISNYSPKHIKIDFYDSSKREITALIIDIPTAIKLSKTIRTHINKVKGI